MQDSNGLQLATAYSEISSVCATGFIPFLMPSYGCTPVKRGWHTYGAELIENGGKRKRPLVTEPKWLSGNLQFPLGIRPLSRILENSIAKPPAGRLNRATYIDRSRNEAANPPGVQDTLHCDLDLNDPRDHV